MHQREETELKGIDFMDYVDIAWTHRWRIIIPTFVLAVLAGIVSFLLPKLWEVDAIIIPSKFLTQTVTGDFKEILVAPPSQIASQISQGSYNSLIAAETNSEIRKFPKIHAENLRNTYLVRTYVRVQDPQKGRQILLALFNHLKSDFDKKIDVEFSNINNLIKQVNNKILDLDLSIESQKIEKEKKRKDIRADQNKLAISEQRITDIQEEMKSVKTRVSELDELQRKTMSEKKDGTETLALLLYSNEVQQNIRYMNELENKVSNERVNIEDLTYSIKSKEQQLLQIDNQIEQIQLSLNNAKNEIQLLEDKKNRIDYSQLVKDPTPSIGPVSPKKILIVLIAGFLGFCLSFGIVLFRDNLEERKKINRSAA